MSQLSVTILTRNEEQNIEACLNSLVGIADEIIVVDSFSDDHTLEICDRYGCKITRRQFNGYGVQRQYATSLTSHPYVLSVDADEVLSEELRQSILNLKEKGFEHRVYAIERHNFYCGMPVKRCGWNPDITIRLFNKRYANWNLLDISEEVTFPDSLRPCRLEGRLLHHRCSSQDELDLTEDRHAGLKGRVIAAKSTAIAPYTPIIRGVGAYLSTYLAKGGILEGSIGRKISRRNFRTELMAYRLARRIIRKQPSK